MLSQERTITVEFYCILNMFHGDGWKKSNKFTITYNINILKLASG